MKWSQIQNTALAKQAKLKIILTSLPYHNIDHVASMYQHLHDTAEPYNEVLDWAVLFHDVIYDEKPAKELRSGLYFIQQAEAIGCDLTQDDRYRVVQLILHTEKHEDLNCPLVRADLHQLANPVKRFHNFVAIMQESMRLYGCDEMTYAQNSETFMNGLADRISRNLYADTPHLYADTPHHRLWLQIYDGVGVTIDLAHIIQGK